MLHLVWTTWMLICLSWRTLCSSKRLPFKVLSFIANCSASSLVWVFPSMSKFSLCTDSSDKATTFCSISKSMFCSSENKEPNSNILWNKAFRHRCYIKSNAFVTGASPQQTESHFHFQKVKRNFWKLKARLSLEPSKWQIYRRIGFACAIILQVYALLDPSSLLSLFCTNEPCAIWISF